MRIIAVLLISLFVSIPIFSTLSLAASIGQPYSSPSGKFDQITVYDQVKKINPLVDRASVNNDVFIQVIVNEDPVDEKDVTFAGTIPFQNCQQKSAGKNLCTLSLPPTTCSGNINYLTGNFQLDFIIDGSNPSLNSIEPVSSIYVISPSNGRSIPVINTQKIKLKYYGLKDNVAQGDCGSACGSGIKTLRIFNGPPSQNKMVGEAVFSTTVEDLIAGNCVNPDDGIEINLNINVQNEEEVILYAQACDNLNHCSQNIVSSPVMVDNSGPKIKSKLLGQSGQETNFYQPNVAYTVESIIDDISQFEESSLEIDLSEFNPIELPKAIIDKNIVSWTFVAQSLKIPTSYTIKAKDKVGNLAVHNQPVNLGDDKEKPQILFLRTEKVHEGISYIGKGDKADIIIEVSDDSSGVSQSTVLLDLSQLGLSKIERPDTCLKVDPKKWQCVKTINTPQSEGTFSINADVQDLVGNTADSKISTVVVDLRPPSNVKVVPTKEIPTSADQGIFGYEIQADDESPLKVFSTFSSLSSGGNVTVICNKNEDCIIRPKNLRAVSGDFDVIIEVSDLAGNKIPQINIQTKILQVQDCKQNPVTLSLSNSLPRSLDKRIASKIPAQLIFPISIDGTNANVRVGDLKVENCDELGGAFSIKDSYIVGNSQSASLFIEIETKAGPGSEIEEIPIDCQISASVAIRNSKCASPLIQNVSSKITATGSPIGDVGKTGREKIGAVNYRINDLDSKIRKYENRMDALNAWCNVAETANDIQIAMSAILSVVQPLSCGMQAFGGPVGVAVGETLWKATCIPTQIVTKVTDYLLWSKSYIPTGPNTVGVVSKWACIIRKCALCNLNEMIAIGVGVARDVSVSSEKLAHRESKKLATDESGRSVLDRDGNPIEAKFQVEPGDPDKYVKDDKGNLIDVTFEKNSKGEIYRYDSGEPILSDDPYARPAKTAPAEITHVGGGSTRVSFTPYQSPQDQLTTKQANDYHESVKNPNSETNPLWIGSSGLSRSTEIANYNDDERAYTWDPYKSIHYAQACFCYNGIIFNLKKERDIQCIYKDCLQDTLSKGLPTTSCEINKKIQECLYVDSAHYKKYGFLLWDNIFEALIRQLIYYFIMLGFDAVCGWTYGNPIDCAVPSCLGWKKTACHLTGAALSVGELAFFKDLGDKLGGSIGDDPNDIKYKEQCG